MPGISSTAPRYENWDMDHLDHYQHYFYDDHHDPDEDFFKSTTAPSEDIWKKFELVPTPPMSPIRAAVEGSAGSRVGLLHHPSLGDKLEWVSQFLGQEDEQQQQQQQQELPCKLTATASDSFGNLSSIILQDCMWSGFSAGQQLERVVGGSCPGTGTGTGTGSAAAKVSAVTSPGRVQQCAPGDASALSGLAADCVDPAAVLTFPLTGGCKKQVSSGSDSHTDSSDDEDDKDEDEEEIDVVTVEHKQQRKPRRLVNARKPVTITVRADPMDPGMKRFHISIHQQQHNYAAPSPDTLPPVEPPRKRVRQEASSQVTQPHQNSHYHQPRPGHAPLNLDRKSHGAATGVRSESPTLSAYSPTSSSSSPSSPPSSSSSSSASHSQSSPSKPHSFCHLSSPQSSDCEDTDKRKAHNFLERKRRNDLRSRFLSLRDEIPGLADCPKTPKVAILTRATEYLQQLHVSERQKAQERKQLKSRQLQLLQRLALLKRS